MFHSHKDVTNDELQNLGLSSSPTAFEQNGVFLSTTPAVFLFSTCCDTGPRLSQSRPPKREIMKIDFSSQLSIYVECEVYCLWFVCP